MADLDHIDHHMRGKSGPGRPACGPDERAIARLATRQHGVVARSQLAALGFGRGAIDRRIASGRLHPLHRGVYAVGRPELAVPGRWLAAVLACGPGALLSHRSAAALWQLVSHAGSRVDVTTPGRRSRRRPGIAVHRVRELHPLDRARRDGIPVTALPRTLLDLAEVLHPHRLGRTFEEAERLGLLDVRAVRELCDRSAGRRGLRRLGALLSESPEPPDTRSALERRFYELCRQENLPLPAFNAAVAGFEVDALWPRERLIVELDGYGFHRTRGAFERDRARDADLQLAGYRVLRITYRRLEHEPAAVVETVRGLLGGSG